MDPSFPSYRDELNWSNQSILLAPLLPLFSQSTQQQLQQQLQQLQLQQQQQQRQSQSLSSFPATSASQQSGNVFSPSRSYHSFSSPSSQYFSSPEKGSMSSGGGGGGGNCCPRAPTPGNAPVTSTSAGATYGGRQQPNWLQQSHQQYKK
jgi:type II secretory pathway pseudopilin PulG